MKNQKISSVLSIVDLEDRDQAILGFLKDPSTVGEEELLKLLNLITGSYEKAEGYMFLNEIFKSNSDKALTYLQKAAEAAVLADELWQKGELLSKIGREHALNGRMDFAKDCWLRGVAFAREGEEIDHPQWVIDAGSTLSEIATNFAEFGMKGQAMSIANAIKNPGLRERTIRSL